MSCAGVKFQASVNATVFLGDLESAVDRSEEWEFDFGGGTLIILPSLSAYCCAAR